MCTRYFAAARSRELTGHRKAVRCVRWNSTGTRLASCSVDGIIRVAALAPLLPSSSSSSSSSPVGPAPLSSVIESVELRGHTGSVEVVAWNRAEPSLLASASADCTVRLWDTSAGGRCTESIACGGELIGLAWSADGRFLAAGSKANAVALIERRPERGAAQLQLLCTVQFATEVNELALPTAAAAASVLLLLLSTGKGTLELLDVQRLKEQAAAAQRSSASASTASSASASPSPPRLSPPPSLCVLDNHTAPVYCVDVSSDGRLLASGAADACVVVRETTELAPVAVLSRSDAAVRSLSFSHPSLGLLALGAEDGLVEISALAIGGAAALGGSARVWSTQAAAETNSVAFHPTLPLLAYATDSKERCTVHLFGVQ